jgi:hypothetical protein
MIEKARQDREVKGRDFTQEGWTTLGHECFQWDDAKTADSLSFSGLFGVGVSIASFIAGAFFVCFLFSYLAFWAPPFYVILPGLARSSDAFWCEKNTDARLEERQVELSYPFHSPCS